MSSSADPTLVGAGRDGGTVLPAGRGATVTSARLDHPLRATRVDPMYADPQLEQVVARAVDRATEQARALGYAQGWAQGRQAAAEATAADHALAQAQARAALDAFAGRARQALTSLEAATRSQRAATAADLAEVGEAVAEGALAIAEAALGRELGSVDAQVAEAVRTALRTLGTSEVTVVHVHPEDLRTLHELPADAVPATVRFEPDPQVPRGGALAVSASRQVLAHLPSAIAAAREALLS